MDDAPPPIEDYPPLPEAEPFSERLASQQGQRRISSVLTPQDEDEESVEAQMVHRRRTKKPLAEDRETELRNSDLQAWQQDYLHNMSQVAESKAAHRLPVQARNNAHHLIWDTGLGGIGTEIGHLGIANPLSIFYGQGLLETITGIKPGRTGEKRTSGSLDGEEDEERRKRQRSRSIDDAARGGEDFELPHGGDVGGLGWDEDQVTPSLLFTLHTILI